MLRLQALGIALESSRLDIITRVYQQTKDTDILSYVMEAVLDSGFTLSFRDKVGFLSFGHLPQLHTDPSVHLTRFSIIFSPSSPPLPLTRHTSTPSPAFMSPYPYHPSPSLS